MNQEDKAMIEKNISATQMENTERYLNPMDISLPPGFQIEVFANGLDTPISMVFTEEGDMLVAEAGVLSGKGRILRLRNGVFEIVADGFKVPTTGVNYLEGDIYVSHRGYITVIKPNGSLVNIISGLPSYGDHHNNQVVFGPDGMMYFGQGTATNSGVVGTDNDWLFGMPYFHDYPGSDILLNGINYTSENLLIPSEEKAVTGAYSPFGEPTKPYEEINGITRASGSILRAEVDGSGLELVAWGLRNPFRLKFDHFHNLFAANHGADVRGSRPIANSPDEFQLILPGVWYGWPDYTGGMPVTLPMFKPEGKPQPQFLIANPPMKPPKPFAVMAPHSAIMGFDFNSSPEFGPVGDAFIAEFGSEAPETTGGLPLPGVGHRISRIDMKTGEVSAFAINKSGVSASETGGGGFERPIDVVFGPDGAMYILDFAISSHGETEDYLPNSGVIWRISPL